MTPADVATSPANGKVSPVPASSMFPETLPQLTPSAHHLERSQTCILVCFTKLKKTTFKSPTKEKEVTYIFHKQDYSA